MFTAGFMARRPRHRPIRFRGVGQYDDEGIEAYDALLGGGEEDIYNDYFEYDDDYDYFGDEDSAVAEDDYYVPEDEGFGTETYEYGENDEYYTWPDESEVSDDEWLEFFTFEDEEAATGGDLSLRDWYAEQANYLIQNAKTTAASISDSSKRSNAAADLMVMQLAYETIVTTMSADEMGAKWQSLQEAAKRINEYAKEPGFFESLLDTIKSAGETVAKEVVQKEIVKRIPVQKVKSDEEMEVPPPKLPPAPPPPPTTVTKAASGQPPTSTAAQQAATGIPRSNLAQGGQFVCPQAGVVCATPALPCCIHTCEVARPSCVIPESCCECMATPSHQRCARGPQCRSCAAIVSGLCL